MSFYISTLRRLVADGVLDPLAPTLVVCGGTADRDAMLIAGFRDVTISNLDTRMTDHEFSPFTWSFQDAEALTFGDGSFVQVIEHAGLHHCASPHRALTEMYRVASRCVVAFEARDSALMRIGQRVGLTSDHEVEAVVAHGYAFGGWRNTARPNYVFRWTEREVTKVVACYDPSGPAKVRFFYGLRLPFERLAMGSPLKRALLALVALPVRAVFAVARRQGNEFAFAVTKPVTQHPWVNTDGSTNRAWLERRYTGAQANASIPTGSDK